MSQINLQRGLFRYKANDTAFGGFTLDVHECVFVCECARVKQ